MIQDRYDTSVILVLLVSVLFTGVNGLSIGIDHYGASAPGKVLADEFGFTAEKIETKIRDHLNILL